MKLLAVSSCLHDSNISYFNGDTVHYHKLERTKQVKHYGCDNIWEWKKQIKEIWNITEDDVDEIAILFDPGNKIEEDYPNEHALKISNVIPDSGNIFLDKNKTWFVKHHYCHSLSGWMMNDEEPDVSIVVDGLGDGRPWSVFRKDVLIASGKLELGSLGWAMRDAGKHLKVQAEYEDDIAGKVMGLQSYGNVDVEYLNHLAQFDSMEHINEIFSIERWNQYNGGDSLDWIRTVHFKMEQVMVNFFSKYASEDESIFYSGGVAQNVIWNTVLKNKFKKLTIAPHSADDGLSLGALEYLRRKNNLKKFNLKNFPYIQSDEAPKISPALDMIHYAAILLSQGKVIAWYQGNGEVGPRALGNRSILMDPRIHNGKEKINAIKRRENYRPFGASVLKRHASDYFEMNYDDDYMLHVSKVKVDTLNAITHVDGTCRVQTVDEKSNVLFNMLLEEFYKITGCPVLLNTSLNLAGKPIAGYPDAAKQLFVETNIDSAFIGNLCYNKN